MEDSRRKTAHPHFAMVSLCLMMCSLSTGAAGSDTILNNFTGQNGAKPYGTLISDGSGNLYGTTFSGGSYGAGTVFELAYSSPGYSETVLHNFNGAADGGFPVAGLVMDGAGNLYGTTSCGGSTLCTGGNGGNGVVFEFSAAGIYSVLYTFTGGVDGANPVASLTFDDAMNLYGTTEGGGRGTCLGRSGCGVVFRLSASSGYHSETSLYLFSGGKDGGVPEAPVIFNSAGTTLYGTTYAGGTGACLGAGSGCGVVFKLTTAGVEKVLHRFPGNAGGGLPKAPVVFDQTGGLLYGTATAGGKTACPGGCGIIFQLSGTLLTTFKKMHIFSGADGADPTAGLALDRTTTYLYGTTFAGGTDNLGVVFELQQTGAYSLLYSFTGGSSDGANPFGGLVLGDNPPDLPGDNASDPPTKKGCPSKCGATLAGGPANLGTAFSQP